MIVVVNNVLKHPFSLFPRLSPSSPPEKDADVMSRSVKQEENASTKTSLDENDNGVLEHEARASESPPV